MATTKWFLYGLFCCIHLSISNSVASESPRTLVHFGVAELAGTSNPHGDAFVITIPESETSLISHARALVEWVVAGGQPAKSPGASIVVAQIVSGSDGVNRNYLESDEALWSWHTVGTPYFADSTIEILDGWPSFVEQDVEGWIENTNGQIGFWHYTVVEELGTFLAGDFDFDGDVDSSDLLVWQRNPAIGYLADWETNYGLKLPASVSSIPEPTSSMLSLLAFFLPSWKRLYRL